MRAPIILLLLMVSPGCAAVATASRTREIRKHTAEMRLGMTAAEVERLLGQPTDMDGVPCNLPGMMGRTCQLWMYDPAAGWPLRPLGTRYFGVMLAPVDGELVVVTWMWE